jgi:hypothetical protein
MIDSITGRERVPEGQVAGRTPGHDEIPGHYRGPPRRTAVVIVNPCVESGFEQSANTQVSLSGAGRGRYFERSSGATGQPPEIRVIDQRQKLMYAYRFPALYLSNRAGCARPGHRG